MEGQVGLREGVKGSVGSEGVGLREALGEVVGDIFSFVDKVYGRFTHKPMRVYGYLQSHVCFFNSSLASPFVFVFYIMHCKSFRFSGDNDSDVLLASPSPAPQTPKRTQGMSFLNILILIKQLF